jgi:hypothetical protein
MRSTKRATLAPRVADEALGLVQPLALYVGRQAEHGLLEARALLCEPALLVHLALLVLSQLNRLVAPRQCRAFPAVSAEGVCVPLAESGADDGALKQVPVWADDRLVARHVQVAPREEALEQTLE